LWVITVRKYFNAKGNHKQNKEVESKKITFSLIKSSFIPVL